MTSAPPLLAFKNLGIQAYPDTWKAMQGFTLSRDSEQTDECWLLEHEPVFTLGQAGKPEHILDAHDVPVIKTDRGGQVTYHGPGQLIAYLLVDIKRRKMGIRQLVDLIENGIIQVLASYDIAASTRKGAPGVYVGDAKIAALGLRIKNGCSYHGLSLNVDMDLEPFSWINPCGYPGMQVTQLKSLIKNVPDDLMAEVRQRLMNVLADSLL